MGAAGANPEKNAQREKKMTVEHGRASDPSRLGLDHRIPHFRGAERRGCEHRVSQSPIQAELTTIGAISR